MKTLFRLTIAVAAFVVAAGSSLGQANTISFNYKPENLVAEYNSLATVEAHAVAGLSISNINPIDGIQQLDFYLFSITLNTHSIGLRSHLFKVETRTNIGIIDSHDFSYPFEVTPAATQITLQTVSTPASAGDAATFTALVTQQLTATERGPILSEGKVAFYVDGTLHEEVPVTNGVAQFTTTTLTAGESVVVANYVPSANYVASESDPLVLNIGGSLVLRQESSGADAAFGFSSATPELNVTVATTGGIASTSIDLFPGSHTITADDMSGAGFGLTSISCDPAAVVDLGGRSATFDIEDGETVTCTFSSVNSREESAQLIEDFLVTRAGLILSNQPDMQRRIDRLNGIAPATGSVFDALTAYLPGVMSSGEAAISASLGQLDSLAGNEKPRDFDVWFEGTFALFGSAANEGVFSAASIGADYVVSRDLLIGAFAQLDHTAMSSTVDSATIGGTGWLVGPYASARLGENVYLDVLAGVGGSANTVSPYGTYEDSFGASRWLISAALQGEWQWDNVSFRPRARLAYFEETTDAYTDGLGVDIPSITAGVGQLALGPALSHRTVTDDGIVIDAGLRAEIVAGLLTAGGVSGFDSLHGRIEASLDLAMPGGGSLGLSLAQDGLGGDTGSTSAQGRVAVPIN